MINGIDVSDPTRVFTAAEWERLSYNGGHQYVIQARERMAGRGPGGRRTRWKRRGGRSNENGGGRNIGAAGNAETDQTEVDPDAATILSGNGERGSQHGRGFGRGAYHAIDYLGRWHCLSGLHMDLSIQ